MRVDLLTREYPPHIYGGAGVHVTELARVLRQHIGVEVRCFDGPRTEPGVTGYSVPSELSSANPALSSMAVDLSMAHDTAGADIVHSHSWYANFAGHIGGLLNGIPHVITAHSLEPLRPWKAEQLGGGYRVSGWIEESAYAAASAIIAVSAGMRKDILRCYPGLDPEKVHVVHNGIDLDQWALPDAVNEADRERVLNRWGIDPTRRSVAFVGRITRQKGVPYLLRAMAQLDPDVQLILCAGSPDTPELAAEVKHLVDELRRSRPAVVWIEEMLPRDELITVLSSATVFACPSIYEPLGIVNLEAMALELPVVATATGGIPEVVQDGVTGLLVPIEQGQDGTGTPLDAERFVTDTAQALDRVLADPSKAREMGRMGRERARDHFSWQAIALTTLEVYRTVQYR